jgi:hypothetical protein
MLHWIGQVAAGLAATAIGAYTFVPRINARIKEIGANHDQRREFRRRITMILGVSSRLHALVIPPDTSSVIADRFKAERERWSDQLEEHTIWLVDTLEWYALGYLKAKDVRALAIGYAVAARALLLSDRPEAEKIRMLNDISTNAFAIFVARRSASNIASIRREISTLRERMNALSTLAAPPAASAPE